MQQESVFNRSSHVSFIRMKEREKEREGEIEKRMLYGSRESYVVKLFLSDEQPSAVKLPLILH